METVNINTAWFKRLLELSEAVCQEESEKQKNYNLNFLLGYISSIEHLLDKK